MIDGVPSSYDELFDEYFGYVKGLVAKLGIRESEDIASEILIRFIARDFLEKYDPTVVGHGKQTNFKAFLRAFVERYVRHYRERQGVRDHREPLQCDKPLASGQVWVEVYANPTVEDPTLQLEEQELVLLMRERVSKMPNHGKRDHLKLFDLIVPQARTFGKLDRAELGRQLGVSSSVISSMIRDMRLVLT